MHRLLLHFGNPLCYIFSESRRGEYSFKTFGVSLAFDYFCLCRVFLWFCNFLKSSSRFLINSLNSSALVLLKVATYVWIYWLLGFFGFLNSVCGIFLLIITFHLLSVVGYPLWCTFVSSSLRQVFFFGGGAFIRDYYVYSTC